MAAETVVGFGVRERDLVAAQVVQDEPGELAIRADLEPRVIRVVGYLQVHDTSGDLGYLACRGWTPRRVGEAGAHRGGNHGSFGQNEN